MSIRETQYTAKVTTAKLMRADEQIVDLLSYLNSDKFNCGDELDGYVNVKDVAERLRSIRELIYKDGSEMGIDPELNIVLKRTGRRQDIYEMFEIVYRDSFGCDSVVGRVGRCDIPEACDFYNAEPGQFVVELYSTPKTQGVNEVVPTMTSAKAIARRRASEYIEARIKVGDGLDR